jgi:osmotically-inducible protein OsmY
MADVAGMVMREIEDDVTIASKDISVQVESKGILKRKRILKLTGSVGSEAEKRKAGQIAAHHAGQAYEVANELLVR